ncbi:CPBP family glutamic-type intramembrane protease [Aquimarina gracilis]|uniref:CPBP family glutamic-type intramembrane protease n=1 Tax=Aquimarina gracilis TaxID=874422 RepID=A0ABU6A0X9_9FLAO|nr:CPBP family glutamic-type intramembrane protease [Aquimarina gracilis]MEB3347771.1 CPBP family glutamic-type intramembrane protease [Aquimarina gracilis]
MTTHYASLMIAYSAAALLWLLFNRFFGNRLWNKPVDYQPEKPYIDFIFASIAILAILGIGQLYINGMLLPNKNKLPIIDAINQAFIFSPTLILVFLRKDSLDSIWLPKANIIIRIGIGLCIAMISLIIYWIVRENATPLGKMMLNIYNPKNISELTQVFMEDITIAMIFVRLSKWIGSSWTIGIVAILFAAGHIPSMIADGYSLAELGSLILDTAIGVVILSVISRSKDVWWFFLVHFTLDMTQYFGSTL